MIPQSHHCALLWGNTSLERLFTTKSSWPRGGVVTQRIANPCTPVRFRAWPPKSSLAVLAFCSNLIHGRVIEVGSGMINIEDSLQFWSIAILAGILFLIMLGGVVEAVHSFFKRRREEPPFPKDFSPSSAFDQTPAEPEPLVAFEAPSTEAPQFLKRSTPRRPPQ